MTESIHSLVPAFAVDALEPDERTMVERHLRECVDCREDLAAFRAATTALADAEATAPPLSMRADVMEQVSRTSQLTPDSADAPATDPIRVAATFDSPRTQARRDGTADALAGSGDDLAQRGRRHRRPRAGRGRGHGGTSDRAGVRRWLPALVGAAATVAIVAVGLGASGTLSGEDAALSMEKDVMMVTSAPDATSMDLDLGTGHLVKSERMDSFALMGAAAPMPDKGTEYQAWLVLEDGSKVAGPTFMPEDDGEYMTVIHSDTATVDMEDVAAVIVTCEPPGGSSEPTTAMVSQVEL